MIANAMLADVAELADALDLGSSTVRCEGSSPFVRIDNQGKCCPVVHSWSVADCCRCDELCVVVTNLWRLFGSDRLMSLFLKLQLDRL